MKVIRQKNVYYIDLSKNLYKGYVETSLSLNKESVVYYKYASMDILNVEIILENGSIYKPNIEKHLMKENCKDRELFKYIKEMSKEEWERERDMSDLLKIKLSDDKPSDTSGKKVDNKLNDNRPTNDLNTTNPNNHNITIRIHYSSLPSNTSISFYKQIHEDDKHKEVVGFNRLGYSSELFPSVWSPLDKSGYPWELIYILPNIEEYKIASPGLLKSFKEEDTVNISMYYVEKSILDFINFVVGTYERVEIYNGDDKRVILIPKEYEEYNDCILEVIEDFANTIKYTEHFLQRSFPNLSVVFTLNEGGYLTNGGGYFNRLTSSKEPISKPTSSFKEPDCFHPTSNLEYPNDKLLSSLEYPSSSLHSIMGIGTSFCNISALTPSKDIEQSFKIKRLIADIVTSQIFYFYAHYLDITDFWIFSGMKGYLEDYCVRFLLGHNDFLYTLKEDKNFVIQNDVYELPLCDSRRDILSYHSDFFRKKSKIIFHILENNLSKAFLSKICSFTLNRPIGLNFTLDFIALIKDVTGKDMKLFFDTYIFRPGLVNINFKFTIDKKKNKVDFKIEQSSTSLVPGCNNQVSGFVTIKSYEVEGTYDHSFRFKDNSIYSNHFYYHTRTKKKKKPEEEEEEIMPLLWIRIDPKNEHFLNSTVEQPDFMYIEQLLDKNVEGQIEAIDYLSKRPSIQICEAFERVLENTQMFYKIRIRILYVLTKVYPLDDYLGFQRVIQFFIKKFCVQSSTVIKPNDFNFVNYFLQKHSIEALKNTDPFILKAYSGREVDSASIICAFMLNILRFNDNSMNSFSDSQYISTVIKSLICVILGRECNNKFGECSDTFGVGYKGNAYKGIAYKDRLIDDGLNEDRLDEDGHNDLDFLNDDEDDNNNNGNCIEPVHLDDQTTFLNYIDLAIKEVERYRLLDMVFPSHENIITESALYFLGRLAINNHITLKKSTLIALSQYPNSLSVRKAALSLLIILFPDEEIINLFMRMIKNETYSVKLLVAEILEQACSRKMININTNLLDNLFPYDLVLRIKIQNILLFLENKDMSKSEYHTKLLEYYSKNYDKDFYYKKTMAPTYWATNTGTVKIRLVNFIELQREYLEKTNCLKLNLKEIKINSHGPTRKKQEFNKNEGNDLNEGFRDHVKHLGVIDKGNEGKNNEDTHNKDNEDTLNNPLNPNTQEVSTNHSTINSINTNTTIKEANIKEMLMEDLYTEELLTVHSKPITLSSPFLEPKPNVESQIYESKTNESKSDIAPRTNESKTNVESRTNEAAFNDPRPKFNPNESKLNTSPRLLVPEKTFDLCDVEKKKEKIEGLFKEMKKTLDRRMERYEDYKNVQSSNQHIVNYDTGIYENERSQGDYQTKFMKEDGFLERLLMEDEDYVEPQPTGDKTLETLLNDDWTSPMPNFSRTYPAIDIDSFLEGTTQSRSTQINETFNRTLQRPISPHNSVHHPISPHNSVHHPISPHNLVHHPISPHKQVEPSYNSIKLSHFNIRMKIGWKICIKAVVMKNSNRPLIKSPYPGLSASYPPQPRKKRGRKPKSDSFLRNHFYDSHRLTKAQRIYQETVRDVSTKPLDSLIFKHRDSKFFSWVPKTFSEIEEMVLEEIGYSSISKELERSLVFLLTYSPFNTRNYLIGKKMFDTYEEIRYSYTPIPFEITEMTPSLRDMCRDFLNNLFLDISFSSFIKPVNTDLHKTYIDIVRFPMCLEIIQKKMNVYRFLESFYGDLKQIMKNCCYFNQNNSEICNNARKLIRYVNDFNRRIQNNMKVKSNNILKTLLTKTLLSRFSNTNEMIYKIENGLYKTFSELFYDIDKMKENYIRVMMSPQQLVNDIEEFKAQVYCWFNVLEGKNICFGM